MKTTSYLRCPHCKGVALEFLKKPELGTFLLASNVFFPKKNMVGIVDQEIRCDNCNVHLFMDDITMDNIRDKKMFTDSGAVTPYGLECFKDIK